MKRFALGLVLVGMLVMPGASMAQFIIPTESTATQFIVSPLFGANPVPLSAVGTQLFTINTGTGIANVTSSLTGSDLPDPTSPGSFLNYFLTNTTTSGTVAPNGGGGFDISFPILFELTITSAPFTGIVFETLTTSLFATTVPSLPFLSGTTFGDPAAPNDVTPLFLKSDPNNVLAGLGISPGDQIGASFGRLVTVNAVPEPSSVLMILGAGAVGYLGYARRRRGLTRRGSTSKLA